MITPELVLKILLSSLIGYVALNSFFRYHFASERFSTLAILLAMIAMFLFKETESVTAIIIIFASLGVAYLVTYLLFARKKQFGYFLLNSTKKDYTDIRNTAEELCKKLNLDETNLIYHTKTPFYMELHNIDAKQAKEFFKSLDNWNNTKKKKVTMAFYWHIVVFLILMVAIWRF